MSTSTKYNAPILYEHSDSTTIPHHVTSVTSSAHQPSSHTVPFLRRPKFPAAPSSNFYDRGVSLEPNFYLCFKKLHASPHSNFYGGSVSILFLQRFTLFPALDNSPLVLVPQAQQLTPFTALNSISDDPNPDSVHDTSDDSEFHGSNVRPFQQPFGPFIPFDYFSTRRPDRTCSSATREYIILEIIQRWIDNPCAERTLWMYGPSSAGGPEIAQKVADANGRDKVAATFFFLSDPSCNDGSRLFTTLAWQLANSIPAIKDHIAHSLNERSDLPIKDLETQFEELIFRPCLALNEQQAPIVVLDSIDEYLDEKLQQRVLNVIGNAVKNTDFPLRFLISSRFNIRIEETFSRFESPILRVDLMDDYDADRAIGDYLRDRFACIAAKKGLGSTWPGQQIVQHLVYKCSGQLLYAALVIGLVSDEDSDAKTQLDIITGLKPRHTTSPYAELDELYLEILKRVLDQDFLKAFLALLIGRSFISIDDLSNDDAMLMDISPVQLENRIREMRSIIKGEPDIDVYNPFLEFLQDSSRAAQYHISRSAGTKQYLELITKSLIERAARLTSQPDFHSIDHFTPKFSRLIKRSPQAIKLDTKDWEQIFGPLLNVLDKLLNLSNIARFKDGYCRKCQFFPITYHILLHLKTMPITEDPVIERYLKSLEEILRYPHNRKLKKPKSKFGHIFSDLVAKWTPQR